MSFYTKLDPDGKVVAKCIDEKTTEDAVKMLRDLIRVNHIKVSDYLAAIVDYDCAVGLCFDRDQDEHFALKFRGPGVPTLMVYPVTAGYGGSGPTACFQCLEAMGFIHGSMDDYPEIFSKPVYHNEFDEPYEVTEIHLVYFK